MRTYYCPAKSEYAAKKWCRVWMMALTVWMMALTGPALAASMETWNQENTVQYLETNVYRYSLGDPVHVNFRTNGLELPPVWPYEVNLPSGLTFVGSDPGSGQLKGNLAPGSGGIYSMFDESGQYNASGNPIYICAYSHVSGIPACAAFNMIVSEPPSFPGASHAIFTQNMASGFTVTTYGYPKPTLLSMSGTLPPGITFTNNGDGTATLSGTPTASASAGNYPLTFSTTTSLGSASQNFTLTVATVPQITSATNTTFTVGTAGSFTVTASGYPTSTLNVSGALPSGISFVDNGNGTATLSGTPAVGSGGSYGPVFAASNGSSVVTKQSFILTVDETPHITSASSTTFVVGQAGSFTVSASGVPAPSFTENGVLPGGVSFVSNGNGTATLSGTPVTGSAGSYPVTFIAHNGIGSDATQSYTLTVGLTPAFTSVTSTIFTAGTAGSFTVAANGYPKPTFTTSGTLPTGVNLVNNGDGTATLTGVAVGGSGGVYGFSITAHNGIVSDTTQSFTLTVNEASAITSSANTLFGVGAMGSFTITTWGYPAPTLSMSGALPSGVTFVDNGTSTATISGTTTASGGYPVTLTAHNGIGSDATQNFTLTVSGPPVISTPVTGNLGANQATLTLQSSATGTGYFTLLSGSNTPCGSGSQVAQGVDGSGAAAYRRGSMPLAANTPGNYTVRNLAAASTYTVCFTAGENSTSEAGSTVQTTARTVNLTTNATLPDSNISIWNKVGSDFSGQGAYTSLAFAPDGTPFVAYSDGSNAKRETVMKYVAGSWVTVGSAGFSSGEAAYTSLVFAPDGTPYVAFKDYGLSQKATVMKFDGSNWVTVGNAAFSSGTGDKVSLAFAPDSTPYVAFKDSSQTNKITVVKFDGSNWVTVGNAGFSLYSIYYSSLAFAPDGTPYLAVKEGNAGTFGGVYKYDTANGWTNLLSFPGATGNPSLVLAPDGTLSLSLYYSNVSNDTGMMMKKYDPASNLWTTDPLQTISYTDRISMDVAPDGVPYVGFADYGNSSKATVKKYLGGSWLTVGNAGFSVGQATSPSLVIAPDGSPFLAYQDIGNSGKATVMGLMSDTVTTIAPSVNPSNFGQTVTFTATITPASAIGTVTFKDGSATLGSATLVSGSATFDTTALGVGDHSITAVYGGFSSSFGSSSTILNQTVNKADQTITFNPPTATYGDTPITLSASAPGGSVSFAVASGPGSITGNVLTITGAGNIAVTASQAGNTSYNPASDIQKTIQVAKAAASVTLIPSTLSATYDGTAKAVSATTIPADKTVTFTYNGSTTAPVNVGSYAVVGTISDANFSGTANGTLVIKSLQTTVTAISPASGITAGGTTVTITGTSFTGATTVTIGGSPATSVSVISDTSITAVTPAGTAGGKDVVITTPAGSGTGSALFTYFADAQLSVTPSDYLFGEVMLGDCSASKPVPFTVTNNGSSDRTLGTLTIVGENSDQFTLSSDTCSGQTVVAQGTCSATVTFCPAMTGSKGAMLNIPLAGVATPVLTALLHNNESTEEEARRRVPPVIYTLGSNFASMTKNVEYTLTWSLLGYDDSYQSLIAFFDCTGISDGSCGASYGGKFAASTYLAPVSTEAGAWSYNGIVSDKFNYSYTFVAPATAKDIVIRFYSRNVADAASGKAGLSTLIPGNQSTTYYDQAGRRILIHIVD